MLHLTLNTGHTTPFNSPDEESHGNVFRALRPIIESGGGEIPGFAGYICKISRLAVILMPTFGLDPESASWIGDFERCLAWSITEF